MLKKRRMEIKTMAVEATNYKVAKTIILTAGVVKKYLGILCVKITSAHAASLVSHHPFQGHKNQLEVLIGDAHFLSK